MKVHEFLDQKHVPYAILTHEPTYDAQHMAHAVHAPGKAVAKTVLLRANHGFRYVTAIVPASREIDFAVASRSLGGCELHLACESEIMEVCPDCEAGILLPFGSQYGVKTIVDSSLAKEDEIVFEGSTHDESIRMKFADFCRIESPLIVPLTHSQGPS
jgi:Ala-tRNA(Pro) deacylase